IDKYLEESYKIVPEPHPIPREEMKTLPINTARGCPYNCTFCYHAFKECRYRYYPFSAVMKEYKRLQERYGLKYLNFWDELTLITKRRAVELCNAIKDAKVEVYWPVASRGNLFTSKDLDLLKKCKEYGALTIGAALESADPAILKAMNKRITATEFIEHMQTARKAGLTPNTSLVFGYPQETKETIKNTIEVCKQAGVYPSVGFVLPLPNTPIYQYAIDHGYIRDEEEYLLRIGDRQDLHVNLTSLSDEELFDTVLEELVKLKNYFGIPLLDKDVIKTTIYKAARKQEGEVSESP
ncbi:MAG: radical SAM protein, partial [Euryarchaeota archaeon]|nr:radical SAM protein [Euryarchaeota archaeon]